MKHKIHTCNFCTFKSKKVEASGMWYCPNAYCSGPGGAWFRSKLKSYQENENGEHTVNEIHYFFKAKKYMLWQRFKRSIGLKHKL